MYASKTSADGTPISGAVISSLFVTGFASSLVFGTVISSVTDTTGRKKAVIICAVFFILSCLSVHASSMPLLYAGRLAGGIASSLLHSAFESWLCTSNRPVRLGSAPCPDHSPPRLLCLQVPPPRHWPSRPNFALNGRTRCLLSRCVCVRARSRCVCVDHVCVVLIVCMPTISSKFLAGLPSYSTVMHNRFNFLAYVQTSCAYTS